MHWIFFAVVNSRSNRLLALDNPVNFTPPPSRRQFAQDEEEEDDEDDEEEEKEEGRKTVRERDSSYQFNIFRLATRISG